MRAHVFFSLGAAAVLTTFAACSADNGGGTGANDLTAAPATPDAGPVAESGAGASDAQPGVPTATGLPCNVTAALKACSTCHGSTPAYGAPMPLVTFADLTATRNGAKVYDLVKGRIHDDARPMPPAPNARLAAGDLSALDSWISAGASASRDSCGATSDPGKTDVKPLSCTPDTFIRPGTPFVQNSADTDIYVCYGFDVTPAQKRHVTALAPKIDNKKIVHHLLLFQADDTQSPTPTKCSIGGGAGWRLISGWAPGGQNLELPAEAGFPEEGTTHWVLQVHYNNTTGKPSGEVDASGYDLCTTDKLRANDADVLATGTLSLTVPPRAKVDITCDWNPLTLDKIHVFGTVPHMHKLGTAMSTYVTKGGAGAPQKVVDTPFDFNTQISYPTAMDIEAGDTVSTRCQWNNSTDGNVTFGEKTTDEMCFNFISYYPKVDSPLWSWVVPSALASCHPTGQ